MRTRLIGEWTFNCLKIFQCLSLDVTRKAGLTPDQSDECTNTDVRVVIWCTLFNKGNHGATSQSQFPPNATPCTASSAWNVHLISPQHVCCMTHTNTKDKAHLKVWKIPTYHIAAVLALVPAEKTEPLECAHTVHTPAGFQHWAGSAGGRQGDSKGEEMRRNPEAQGSQVL